MKSGSKELQKAMELQVPRLGGELKKEWFVRVADFFEIEVGVAENLYYREGYSVPNETYIKLRNLGQIPTTPSENRLAASLKRQDENNRDLQELAELKKEIKNEILGQFGEALKQFASAMETMAG